MSPIAQTERPLRIAGPGSDDLLVIGFEGHESISRPFLYTLDLLSTDDAIDGQARLRKAVSITIDRGDQAPVVLHGLIRRFRQLGKTEGYTSYRAEIVPWFWFLSLTNDCRIFQDMAVPAIIARVFIEAGFLDFKVNCRGSYAPREYCVQYRESNLAFVSRLLEEEGIHYYFEHASGKHTLVLSDQSALAPECDDDGTRMGEDVGGNEDVVHRLEADHGVYIGQVALRDFDFVQAPAPLSTSISGAGKEPFYDYHPGRFTTPSAGERVARLELEAQERLQHVVHGSGAVRYFRAGTAFTLKAHYRSDANQKYLLTSVVQRAAGGDLRSGATAVFDHTCEFEAIPIGVPFRPGRLTPKPVVAGSQTAVVVGPSGEEIYVDKYGRVKVRFHWDRGDTANENASCWVRAATTWAGKNWGTIQLPRAGEEVIVAFLEGDPDQPIIIGRVYNADQMPPYALPANKTQSGMKTRSSKQGDASMFNEIRFEDLKGSEHLYVHAQKDKVVMVENDRTEEVGHDEVIVIRNDRTETVENDEKITITRHRTEEVGGDETIKVTGKRTEAVDGDEKIKIGGKRETEVSGDEKGTFRGKRTVEVTSDDQLTVNGKTTIKGMGAVLIEGMMSIELKVGGNSIKIEQSGITVKGLQVEIDGGAMATMKAAMTKIEGSAIAEVKGGAMLKLGGGMLQAQGGITMIN
jgi:type VI secretion system secreted protein VgrG